MKYTGVKLTSKDLNKTREFYETLFDLKTVDIDNNQLVFENNISFVKNEKWKKDIDKKTVSSGNSTALCFFAKDLEKLREKFFGINLEINYVDTISLDDPDDGMVRIFDPDKHIVEIEYSDPLNDRKNKKLAQKRLESKNAEAEKLLEDDDQLEAFLFDLAKKVQKIPAIGNKLKYIPVLASLVNDYVKKRYTKMPKYALVAIVSALIYFVSILDAIPDTIPIIGLMDDGVVVSFCWSFVNADLEDYIAWAKENGKDFEMIMIDPETEAEEFKKKQKEKEKEKGSSEKKPSKKKETSKKATAKKAQSKKSNNNKKK